MTKEDFIMVEGFKHVRYRQETYTKDIMQRRSNSFFEWLDKRRSVRQFTDKPVDAVVIENIIKAASTAPSGAHKQPWTFCVVQDQTIKSKIRVAAEEEERRSYSERMSESWIKDLKPLGTDSNKPFLEIAPYLIIVFKKPFEYDEGGNKCQNYYVNESVGLACGMLITAIHNAGLVTLTHTPSPMRFLEKILNRPDNERAFLLLPVGYAADEVYVPDIHRKTLSDVMEWY
jgi:nitroreductase